nr:MAG TPA: hypothetical protein [Caudoviricetes sp.]
MQNRYIKRYTNFSTSTLSTSERISLTPPKQNPIKRNKRETADLQPKRSKLAVFYFV